MGPFEIAPGTQWDDITGARTTCSPDPSCGSATVAGGAEAAAARRHFGALGADHPPRHGQPLERGAAVLVVGVDAPDAINADHHDLQVTRPISTACRRGSAIIWPTGHRRAGAGDPAPCDRGAAGAGLRLIRSSSKIVCAQQGVAAKRLVEIDEISCRNQLGHHQLLLRRIIGALRDETGQEVSMPPR